MGQPYIQTETPSFVKEAQPARLPGRIISGRAPQMQGLTVNTWSHYVDLSQPGSCAVHIL